MSRSRSSVAPRPRRRSLCYGTLRQIEFLSHRGCGHGSLHGHLGRLPRRAAPSPTTGRTCRRRSTTTSTRGAPTFENPYDDLEGDDAGRNWDSDRRLAELEADGVVAEVIFPNTIPPFFPQASLVHQPPAADAGDLALRWEGLRAHNRWLADFCAAAPGRRAGIAQILLHDVDAAVDEIRWAAGAGLTGGVLLPGHAARARACRRCTRPTTSRSGGRARSSACRQPPHRQRVARLRRLPRGQGHVPRRGDVVGAPGAVAAHLLGRDGAPPDAAVRVHRAGHRVAARAARHPRRLRRPHVRRGRVAGARSSAPT